MTVLLTLAARLAGGLGFLALVAIGLAILFQRQLMYFPDPTRIAPEAEGLKGVTEEIVETPGGVKLVTWWSPPRSPGKPVVIYFHGNGANLAVRGRRIELLQGRGYGVLMLSYRGYGGSGGKPSEAALVADAGLIFERVVAKGIDPSRIVLFGESLGTGVAVQVAASRTLGGVILDSPYTSMVDVAEIHRPYMPVRRFLWDRYDSLAVIGRVHAPLLILHGEADSVVPYALGQRLFAAANEPKTFITLPGAGHVSPLNEVSWAAIVKLLEGVEAAK